MESHLNFIFLEYFLLLICSISVIVICFYFGSTLYVYTKMKGEPGAPYIPLAHEAIAHLVSLLQLSDGHIIYDLGCGDARVIHALSKTHRKGHYKGVERNLFVYLFARIRTVIFSLQNLDSDVHIMYGDIFKQDLHDATHIVTYLFPEVMNVLLPKLQKELQRGTLLYSVDFMFENKEPKNVVMVHSKKWTLGQNVYIYEF